MNREPKISEIEKLINHFKKTDREDELFEILEKHNIGEANPIEPIEPGTNEINPEALNLFKIAKKEGLKIYKSHPFKKIFNLWKHNWIFRYSIYYIFLFLIFMFSLNAPMFFTMVRSTDDTKAKIITVQEVEKFTMEKSAPLEPGEIVTADNRLYIPKINVDAPIIMGTSNEESIIQSNLTKGVVHYLGTAEPGHIGNSFITGHSSNFWWIKGNYNYIFVNLSKLAIGDQAKIYYQGNKFVYQVKEVKEVLPEDVSVLAQGDTPILTLMTCTPAGTNWRRLIVVLDQISPTYIKPKVVTKQIVDQSSLLPSTDSNSIGGVIAKMINSIKKIFGN